jgi:dimethylaniline monooxygenase (N-oxide forming)
VTLLAREAHWPVPRKILDLIPFKFATYSRFGHALLPTHHDVSALAWWLHALFTPLKWLVWRLVELIFRLQFQIPKEMLPSSRIEIDTFTGGQILTYEARDMINAGELKICRGAIERYTPTGIALKRGVHVEGNGTASIDCNMVVYGTGFTKTYDYLEPSVRAALQIHGDGLYLYRSVLPVGVPDLAFLGAEVSTFNNILTHGLQAAWLSAVLCGSLKLPLAGEMQRSVEKEMHWKRTWMPSTSARAAIQQLHMPKYHDKLVEDMGYATCRKSNPMFELLSPYTARDYRPIFGLADETNWMRLKTAAVLLALLLLSPLMAAVVCVGVYLLPEQPPSALAKPKAAGANAEPLVARRASPAIAAPPGLRMRSALAAARTAAGA